MTVQLASNIPPPHASVGRRPARWARRIGLSGALVSLLTTLGLIFSASPAMAYGYRFEYRIATTSVAANDVYRYVNSHFNTVFPQPGNCGRSLYVGKRCDLVGNGMGNIEVVEVGSRHFAFKSLPGHFEGANKRVNFTLENRGRDLYLTVTGSGGDNWWQKIPLTKRANRVFAEGMFGMFANNIRNVLIYRM